MRPVKLTIEGINSFIDAQELDFEAAGRSNLFCICGKTGAGKSTIFDSIMLALYGKSGRSGKSNFADMVNLSRTGAAVSLEFAVGSEMYRVDRSIKCAYEKDADGNRTSRRRLQSTESMLYRGTTPIATGSDDVDQKIREIIGVDASEFKNVYLLEQGEYAEFLKKTPANQLETVGKIFSLMRFSDVYRLAKEKKSAAEQEIKSANKRLEDHSDVTEAAQKEIRSKLASLRAKAKSAAAELEKLKAEIEQKEKARDIYLSAVEKQKTVIEQTVMLDKAKERLNEAARLFAEFKENDRTDELKTALAALRERTNALSALAELDRQLAAAEKAVEQKECALKKAEDRYAVAAKNAEALEAHAAADKAAFDGKAAEFTDAASGLVSPSEAVDAAVNAIKSEKAADKATSAYYELCAEKNKYDALKKELDGINRAVSDAKAAADAELDKIKRFTEMLKNAEAELKSAEENEQKAKDELTKAQIGSHAAAVRAELKAGDVCPVCGGVYNGGGCESADLGEKKTALENAQKERRSREAAVSELDKRVTGAKTEYDRRMAEAESGEQKAKAVKKETEETGVQPEIYEIMLRALGAARERAESYTSSAGALQRAKPELAAAAAEVKGAEDALSGAKAACAELGQKLGDRRGKTDAELKAAKEECDRAERELAEVESKKRAIAAEKDAAAAAVAAVEEMLKAARRECPADIPEFDEEEYRQKRADAEKKAAVLSGYESEIKVNDEIAKNLDSGMEKKRAIEAEKAEYEKQLHRYSVIESMTYGKAMLNYVATEYIEEFTAAASDILGSLTGGKYSMSYEKGDGFMVSDYLNGGRSRKTDTLSGGELFLASLAVAIAIARAQGAQVGSDNAFFFLDEGFGTLDDELIDTVYMALEELARSCLVGVISHSGSLIERMPARVEVEEATDTAGSRIRVI